MKNRKGYKLKEWTDATVSDLIYRAMNLDIHDEDAFVYEDFTDPDEAKSDPLYSGSILVWKEPSTAINTDADCYAVMSTVSYYCGDEIGRSEVQYVPIDNIIRLEIIIKNLYIEWCNENKIDYCITNPIENFEEA